MSRDCQKVVHKALLCGVLVEGDGMIQKLIKMTVICCAVLALAGQSFAQNAAGSSASDQRGKGMAGPRRQLATIVFAGLGGAILGLSTLSFYGSPQNNLQNIPIGFGIGLIAGITFATARVIANPQELYGIKPGLEEETAHGNSFQATNSMARPAVFKFNFDF
jgi:hypothetical protein